MTIAELRAYIHRRLTEAGIAEAEPECRIILEHIGVTCTQTIADPGRKLGPRAEAAVAIADERADTRRPLQYILGQAWFYGRPYAVDSRCLIPRFDTEILCREAIDAIADMDSPGVLDLCTGSGCVAITIAAETGLQVLAADLSPDALQVAGHNADSLGADVVFCQGDMFRAIEPGRTFDLIVCNPPYVDPALEPELAPEVTVYEPHMALYAENRGLYFYRILAKEASAYLNDGGQLMVEIGDTQGPEVVSLFSEAGFRDIQVVKDYGNNDRVVKARK